MRSRQNLRGVKGIHISVEEFRELSEHLRPDKIPENIKDRSTICRKVFRPDEFIRFIKDVNRARRQTEKPEFIIHINSVDGRTSICGLARANLILRD